MAVRLRSAGRLLAEQHVPRFALLVRAQSPLDRAPVVAVRHRTVGNRLRPSDCQPIRQVGPQSGDCDVRRANDAGVGDFVSCGHHLSGDKSNIVCVELHPAVSSY